MIRLLIFFLLVIFFASAASVVLTQLHGAFLIEAFGWRFDLPMGGAILLALLAVALFTVLVSTAKDIINTPKRARARAEIRRRENGLNAVTNGLKSIAAGDAAGARKHARKATKSLQEAPVAKLLAAQAAQLSGDDAAAGEALAGLLEAPETEFLALRGLYAKARREGDLEAATRHARRAFALHPGARWAFDGVFEAALDEGEWDRALMALEKASGMGAIEKEKAIRGEAALAVAAAYEYAAGDDAVSAQQKAEVALNLVAGFAPAAVLAAKIRAADGRPKKAEKVLSKAFAENPSQLLIEALLDIFKDEPAERRAARLDRLAEKNPASREGVAAAARARLIAGEPQKAIELLEPIAEESLSGDVALLLAEALEAHQGAAAAHSVLRLAAAAPRENSVHAESFERLSREGWRRVVLEFMETGRIAPPPLEGAAPGIAREEFLVLAAPKVEPAPAPEPEVESEIEAAPTKSAEAMTTFEQEAKPAQDVEPSRALGDLASEDGEGAAASPPVENEIDETKIAEIAPDTDENLESEAAAARRVS